MTPFLFFLLQSSSLILIKTFVTGSSIYGQSSFYFNEDNEYDLKKNSSIILPSHLDLNFLNFENDQMETDSPSMSDINFIFQEAYRNYCNAVIQKITYDIEDSSPNNSLNYININEYSHPSQILTVEDDYFFLYLDNSENQSAKDESYYSSQSSEVDNSKPVEVQVNSLPPKFNEELILIGSELVPKDQVYSIERNDDLDEDDTTRSSSDPGIYELIMNNFLMAISIFSPESVRQTFEPEPINQVTVEDPMLKKESSDEFSDMIKRYYKHSYVDLEKAEHLTA